MYISTETADQTQARLLKVIAAAELNILAGSYTFIEHLLSSHSPFSPSPHALACVRDDEVWSELVPSSDPGRELFSLFCFHFQPALDNSGFVGWLASIIKAELGSGVLVVCGQNSSRGGIFDYWGIPLSMGDKVVKLVEKLRTRNR